MSQIQQHFRQNKYGEYLVSTLKEPVFDKRKIFAFAVDTENKETSTVEIKGKTIKQTLKMLNNSKVDVNIPIWKTSQGEFTVPRIMLCIDVSKKTVKTLADEKKKYDMLRITTYGGEYSKNGVSYKPVKYMWFPMNAQNIVVEYLHEPEPSPILDVASEHKTLKCRAEKTKVQEFLDSLTEFQMNYLKKWHPEAVAVVDNSEESELLPYMGICITSKKDCFFIYDKDPLHPYTFRETITKFVELSLSEQVDALISSVYVTAMRRREDGKFVGSNGYETPHLFELKTGTFEDPYVSSAPAAFRIPKIHDFETGMTVIRDVRKNNVLNFSFETKEIPGQDRKSQFVSMERVTVLQTDIPKSEKRMFADACIENSGKGKFEKLIIGKGKDTFAIKDESPERYYDDANEKSIVEKTEKYEPDDWIENDPVEDNEFTKENMPPNTVVCEDKNTAQAVLEMVKFRDRFSCLIHDTESVIKASEFRKHMKQKTRPKEGVSPKQNKKCKRPLEIEDTCIAGQSKKR